MLELKVANKGCIRRISARSLRAAKTRNLIAVLAIALTTLLFMSLFSIAGAIVNSFQESTFRQVGGRFHGTFKDVTQEQIDELSTDERIKSIALRQMLGMPTAPPFNKAQSRSAGWTKTARGITSSSSRKAITRAKRMKSSWTAGCWRCSA